MSYLDRFYKQVKKKWQGSLVKVEYVREIEPNAKEYLNKLSKDGRIERISWGWYWIPTSIDDFFDFLRKDKNFKMISSQTAASFWNGDFIHRDIYNIRVKDRSYGEALKSFASNKGWTVFLEDCNGVKYTKIHGLYVENIKDTIINCIRDWAFTDAFAVLYSRRDIELDDLSKMSYWKRISRSDVRIRQALEYGCQRINEIIGEEIYHVRKIDIVDDFLRRNIDDAVEKVTVFA